MPRGDKTGPKGTGAMTGRGAGYCTGYGVPGFANPVGGRVFEGRAFGGGGRGHCNWLHAAGLPGWMRFRGAGAGYGVPEAGFAAPAYGYPAQTLQPDPEMEKPALKRQAEILQANLDEIGKRLSEIESATLDSKP